jgi:DMSO/TMAO reductase YedYZ molybdopterin-dependent catalytic subunit
MAASLPVAYTSSGSRLLAEEQPAKTANEATSFFPGVITRQKDPDNVEFPFATLNSFLTPNEQFFVRSHFPSPQLDIKSWKLTVQGTVERTIEIGYDELVQMPSKKVTALLECSGNSRVFLKPPQAGIRWEQGAVSNAEWTGVALSAVLQRAGVRPGSVEVILEGADQGEFKEPNPKSPGVISYARSLPLEKANQPEVMLAYKMNGKELPPEHGYPIRAIVPGWYGMASVKWLKRIIVTDRPFHGYFQTFTYTIWQRREGLPDLVSVHDIQVKSQIARPMLNEVVPANSKVRIHGAAWTGDGQVAKVEVSTDGGSHWTKARLLGDPVPFAWRMWEFQWSTPAKPGRLTLLARATDDQGRVQPMERDEDRRDAVISHVQPITVELR